MASDISNATLVVQSWYDEGNKYNYQNPSYSTDTAQFVQVVWKATNTLGCGRTLCNGKNGVPGYFVRCFYLPWVNATGDYPANVQAPMNQC